MNVFRLQVHQQQHHTIHPMDPESPYQTYHIQNHQSIRPFTPQTDISETNSLINSPQLISSMKDRAQETTNTDEDSSDEEGGPRYLLKCSVFFADRCLVLTLHELSGVPCKMLGGFDLVRISINLLPGIYKYLHCVFCKNPFFVKKTPVPFFWLYRIIMILILIIIIILIILIIYCKRSTTPWLTLIFSPLKTRTYIIPRYSRKPAQATDSLTFCGDRRSADFR